VRPPFTIWAYAAVLVAVLIAVLVAHGVDGWLVGGGSLMLVATFALVRGAWPAWVFLAVVSAGSGIEALVRGWDWWPVLVNTTLLALLLMPPTWRHARRWRPRVLG
jgi:hypothetical protein